MAVPRIPLSKSTTAKLGNPMDPFSSIPSINGGDAGPSSADAMFGASWYEAPYSAPFIFGGSGAGVDQSSTSWPTVAAFGLVALVLLFAVKAIFK